MKVRRRSKTASVHGGGPGRWLVLSPHCDDAVLSLGAALSAHVRTGGSVTILTVLAGEPRSSAVAGAWDASAGFATEGDAAGVRRSEDEAACQVLGAAAVHLSGVDEQYGPSPTEGELWPVIRALALDHDLLLIPGFPLKHPDHRRLARRAVDELLPSTLVCLYGEEPYLLWDGGARPSVDERAALLPVRWRRVRVGASDRVRKIRAVSCYRSQLRLLAEPLRRRPFGGTRARLLLQLWLRAGRGEWMSEAEQVGSTLPAGAP